MSDFKEGAKIDKEVKKSERSKGSHFAGVGVVVQLHCGVVMQESSK